MAQLSPNAVALSIALLCASSGVALAEPINKHTITGRSSAAAIAQGVPLDQTPRAAPSPEAQAAAGDATDPAAGAASVGASPAMAKPRVVRYGLLGLSWRSE